MTNICSKLELNWKCSNEVHPDCYFGVELCCISCPYLKKCPAACGTARSVVKQAEELAIGQYEEREEAGTRIR